MRYELAKGKSSKFWQIEPRGKGFAVTWGRIGTAGRTLKKTFATADAAHTAHDKLVREKLREGYVEAGGAPAAIPPRSAARRASPNNGYTTRPPPVDVAKLIPGLRRHRLPAVRLHPRRAAGLPHRCSKMGGVFLGNAPEGWPYDAANETNYVGVLQLLAEDMPELPFPPGTDVMQLLWSTHDGKDDLPDLVLRWLDSRAAATRPENPPFKPHEFLSYVPAECAVHPERIDEYPDGNAFPRDLEQALNECEALAVIAPDLADTGPGGGGVGNVYHFLLGAAPGCKVGGHPAWVQYTQGVTCSKCGEPMEYLLTVASREWDGASYRRWKPIEDGSPTNPQGHSDDADLMLGDAGAIYVFLCRTCTPWRGQGVLQCS